MESLLSLITANFSGRTRRAKLNGREYVVCNVVMIVPGVLPGSRGELFYPEDEVANSVPLWDGMPLTARHPTINGQPVGARNPEVVNKFWLGHVFNSKYDGRLGAEAWFDVELTNRIDPRIVPYLESGKKIEVSTGLFTSNEPAQSGSTFNGKSYTHIARNYKPDHLAILMDEIGACSIQDGCGLNVNHSNPHGDSSVNKEQLITWLTTNCTCWKGPNASAALNAMTEQELNQLKTTTENSINTSKQLQTVTNALGSGFVVNGVKVVLDTTTGQFKAEQVQPTTPATNGTPQVIEIKPVGQQVDNRTESFTQMLERTGTPQEKALWNSMVADRERQKATIIANLTANITEATKKAAAVAAYQSMDLDILKTIAPPDTTTNNAQPAPNYSLGAGGPLVNQNQGPANVTVNKVDGLPITRIQFENPITKK